MKGMILILIMILLTGCQAQLLPAPAFEETAAPLTDSGQQPEQPVPPATPSPQPPPTATFEEVAQTDNLENRAVQPLTNRISDYPPSDTPYWVESHNFWLVHTLTGRLFAFAPAAPEYTVHNGREGCLYTWSHSAGRFIDPCSGDEWGLTGAMNGQHSTERWSRRDLDQYPISVQEGQILVQVNDRAPGLPIDEPPLALDTQYGVTMTVVAADFGPHTMIIDTLTQVDPIWGMDAAAFPPQQALTYPTFPDSIFDDQGRVIEPVRREGGWKVSDARTGGIRQLAYNHWQGVSPDASVITATLNIHLSNLYRTVTLPVDWSSLEEGDVWIMERPLELGYVAARIHRAAWIKTMIDGRVQLRLTVIDDSPEEIRLYCLHLDTVDPWQRTCANFDGERTYTLLVWPDEPVALHLRAALELLRPFQLVIDVARP